MAELKGRLGKYNVAHKLYKGALLNTVCFVAGISIFFFGYDQGLMGGVNTSRHYVELMGFGHWDDDAGIVRVDDTMLQGFINACYYLPGTLVGCLLGGWLGDRYGRTTTIGYACVWSMATAALQSAAQSSDMMIVGGCFLSSSVLMLRLIHRSSRSQRHWHRYPQRRDACKCHRQ